MRPYERMKAAEARETNVLQLPPPVVRKDEKPLPLPGGRAARPQRHTHNDAAHRRLSGCSSAASAATAMWRASTSKNALSAARVSLRPKPSVPSAT